MTTIRGLVRDTLPPSTLERLRALRHASAEAIAGPDLYHLRVDLERLVDQHVQAIEALQEARLNAARDQLRDELTRDLRIELDRWGRDLMDRMDILFGAWSRTVSSLEDRVKALEERASPAADGGINGHAPASPPVEAIGSPVAR